MFNFQKQLFLVAELQGQFDKYKLQAGILGIKL
jgi:hypothetical protein